MISKTRHRRPGWGYVSRAGHTHSTHEVMWSFDDNHKHECATFGKDFSVSYGSVLKKAIQDCPSIAMDSDVLGGSPRITGTRVPVYMVLDAVQHYGTVEGVKTSYPQLTTEQVKEALSFAGSVLEQPIEYEP
jgi:uncharacterized protein (DUF433 family)